MSLNSRLVATQVVGGTGFKLHPCTRFAVSACGKVLGRTGKVLRPKTQGNYLIVSYNTGKAEGNKIRHMYVHRLVAGVWLGAPPTPDHEVNHKDGDKTNNRKENLEWVHHSENQEHARAAGLIWNLPKPGQCGFQCAS